MKMYIYEEMLYTFAWISGYFNSSRNIRLQLLDRTIVNPQIVQFIMTSKWTREKTMSQSDYHLKLNDSAWQFNIKLTKLANYDSLS